MLAYSPYDRKMGADSTTATSTATQCAGCKTTQCSRRRHNASHTVTMHSKASATKATSRLTGRGMCTKKRTTELRLNITDLVFETTHH